MWTGARRELSASVVFASTSDIDGCGGEVEGSEEVSERVEVSSLLLASFPRSTLRHVLSDLLGNARPEVREIGCFTRAS